MAVERLRWRLIKSPPNDGAWNMGVDEALLEYAEQCEYDATLRLYAWQPACLSLGFGQPFRDVDIDRIRRYHWGVVRRITGGRAILHTDEITYSVVGRTDERHLQGDIAGSYQRISLALMGALERLGLQVEANENRPESREGGASAICFEAPGTFEITVGGKKLVGSAQARRSYGVLQHGSLPLRGDIARITQALRYGDEKTRCAAAEGVSSKAITVEAALGNAVSWDTAAEAFKQAFEERLGVEIVEAELEPEEERRAVELSEAKYNQSEWLERI